MKFVVALLVLSIILFGIGFGLRTLGVPWYVAAIIVGALAGTSVNAMLD